MAILTMNSKPIPLIPAKRLAPALRFCPPQRIAAPSRTRELPNAHFESAMKASHERSMAIGPKSARTFRWITLHVTKCSRLKFLVEERLPTKTLRLPFTIIPHVPPPEPILHSSPHAELIPRHSASSGPPDPCLTRRVLPTAIASRLGYFSSSQQQQVQKREARRFSPTDR